MALKGLEPKKDFKYVAKMIENERANGVRTTRVLDSTDRCDLAVGQKVLVGSFSPLWISYTTPKYDADAVGIVQSISARRVRVLITWSSGHRSVGNVESLVPRSLAKPSDSLLAAHSEKFAKPPPALKKRKR